VYDIRDVLGQGTVGEVRRAIHRATGQERAVKIIAQQRNRSHHLHSGGSIELEAEAAILRELQHPFVVRLLDVYSQPNTIFLVMELMPGGDLFDRIVQKGKYTEVEARRVMRRLINAVYYLHERKNVVHRDLKPENSTFCGYCHLYEMVCLFVGSPFSPLSQKFCWRVSSRTLTSN
jgi:serine/threonine protein kinase